MKRIPTLALPFATAFLLSACLGKMPGAGVAKYAADVNVDTSCQAYTTFITPDNSGASIQSRIYASCQTCHSPNSGAGAAMYTIRGPNPSDEQLVANYIEASGRMLYAPADDVSKSDLIQYGRAYKSHTGGAAFTVEDELALTNWAADLSSCTPAANP
ncbi:MAG: hypothetical protein H7333_05330 [Bdellovibrionales bacterium]|nr:hypothetical protein [Oligoflexia bacterium]